MKKIKINIPELIMFGIIPLLNIIIIILALIVIFTTPTKVAKQKRIQQTNVAYRTLVHRIWLENPSYVVDYLTETDEFCTLDSLDNTLHEIFHPYSRFEQEEYEYNRAHEAEHVIIRHDPGCCTVNIE